jgi:hypothetical protein
MKLIEKERDKKKDNKNKETDRKREIKITKMDKKERGEKSAKK